MRIPRTCELGKVLPGTVFIFYLPQNSGPDILKGNDQRLIKSFTLCFCLPLPTLFASHYCSLLSICCSYQNKSFAVLKKVNTQSNPLLAKMVFVMQNEGSGFIGTLALAQVASKVSTQGKHILALVICHACHRSSQDSGSFAEDISYPHKTSACLLFELISHNLICRSQRTAMRINFPDVWASSKFEGKNNQKNLTVSAGKGWCTLTTACNQKEKYFLNSRQGNTNSNRLDSCLLS